MMIDSIQGLKTDPRLLAAARSARATVSPKELLEQKVSYVFGSMGKDSTMTKEEVRRAMLKQVGEISA